MRSSLIIEKEVMFQSSSGIARELIVMQINLLILYGTPKPFCEDIVKGTALAIHTDLNIGSQKALDVLRTSEMVVLRCDFSSGIYIINSSNAYRSMGMVLPSIIFPSVSKRNK